MRQSAALWYYGAVARVLVRRHPTPRSRELARLVGALERRLRDPELHAAPRR